MQSADSDSDAMREDTPNRAAAESSRRISAYKLLNLFCAATAGLWILLLAITFTDNSPLIVLATCLWLFAASLSFILACYLAKRKRSARSPAGMPSKNPRPLLLATIMLAWSAGTLLTSNFIVDY